MRVLLAGLFLTLASAGALAAVQPACGPKQELVTILETKYKEAPFFKMRSNHGPVELWANLLTGSWTLIMFPKTAPGLGCLYVGGTELHPGKLPSPAGTGL